VVRKKKRETSATECQIRGHGCGAVLLKFMEQHVRAKQEHCQQTIGEIGAPSGLVIIHFAAIPNPGKPAAQLFVAVFESSVSTPAAHALANE
jgi:hypothetical protein